jgi:hypothetical protein
MVVLVDKGVELSELEFQRRTGTPVLDDLGEGTNDIQSVLDITLVVVGHVQDKEIFKIKFLIQIFLRLWS